MQTDDHSHVKVANPLGGQTGHFVLTVFNSASDDLIMPCVTHFDKAEFWSWVPYSTWLRIWKTLRCL